MNIAALMNGRTGIVNKLTMIKSDYGAPRIFNYGAQMARVNNLPHSYAISKNSGGAGFSDEQAKRSAIGELVERYCCAQYDADEIIFGSYNELKKDYKIVNPKSFSLFSDRQYLKDNYPFAKMTENSVIGWCQGRSLEDGEKTLVPAGLSYLPYIYKREKEDVISPSISTGAAAGPTLERAIISGIYECVERDNYTIHWLNQLPAKKIVFDSDSNDYLNSEYKKFFQAEGYTYYVYDITNDLGITTIYTIAATEANNRKIFMVGTGTDLNPARAVLKAMKEAVQGKAYVISEINKDPLWQPKADFSDVDDFSVSAKLYTVVPKLQEYLLSIEDRIIEEVPASKIENVETEDELKTLLNIFKKNDIQAYYVNLTTCDSYDSGIYVAKVIIPQLQPLHGNHNYPFLGGARLYEVPCKLGYLNKPNTEDYFMAVKPHPFP